MIAPLGPLELKALDDTQHNTRSPVNLSHAACHALVASGSVTAYVLMASGLIIVKTTCDSKGALRHHQPQFSQIIKSLCPRLGDAHGEAQMRKYNFHTKKSDQHTGASPTIRRHRAGSEAPPRPAPRLRPLAHPGGNDAHGAPHRALILVGYTRRTCDGPHENSVL
jgi:hypothetical protein